MRVYRENPLAEIPSFATEGSACFDIRACLGEGETVEAFNPHNRGMQMRVKAASNGKASVPLQPGFRMLVPTGLIFDIPKNHVLDFFIRSSMALKYGIVLANGVAKIDSDYVDPSYIMLLNMSDTPYHIYHGDRIAQGELRALKSYDLSERKSPPSQKTDREGGFGSTGTE